MIEAISLTLTRYWDFYSNFFSQQWHDMTPAKYGSLLIGIGVFGWLLMKSGAKK